MTGMSVTVPSAISRHETNITLWTTPDRIQNFHWALDSAAAILPNYEALFNYPYFLPKLDILALPDFLFEAMENWVKSLCHSCMLHMSPGMEIFTQCLAMFHSTCCLRRAARCDCLQR